MKDSDYDLNKELDTLRRSGEMIKMKSGMIYEEIILPALALRARDPDTTTPHLVEIAKTLIDTGELKPSAKTGQGAAGPGFSITFNVPGAAPTQVTINAAQDPATPEPLDVTPRVVVPFNTPVAEPEPHTPPPNTPTLLPPPSDEDDPFMRIMADLKDAEAERLKAQGDADG